jgi:tRNA A37 threonylcarbamoyladenosine dehydratase
MSQQLISRSADLRRLRDDGYEVAIAGADLVITHVPYVNARRKVKYGTLVSELTLSGDSTAPPASHVAYFRGDCPCDRLGVPLAKVVLDGQLPHQVTEDLVARYTLSSRPRPAGQYPDYYEKMTTYISILGAHAQALAPAASARTYRITADGEADPAFRYLDTASSRAGINLITGKLAVPRVAIVGLGGTGSYILDLVAKTPVGEIHLFDGDRFLQHNAFRAPGAATIEDLRQQPMKVDYLAARYVAMRRGLIPHACRIDARNVSHLDDMVFVFLAIDDGPAKKTIVDHLELRKIPFIDVGIGVYEANDQIAGLVRTTLSTEPQAVRESARARIPFDTRQVDGMYGRNIQIADLNALGAVLAVIAWKKFMGFYSDLGHERFAAYAIDTNSLINDDQVLSGDEGEPGLSAQSSPARTPPQPR